MLAELGYEGVALTLDHAHLDPFAPGLAHRTARLGKRLADLGLAVVVETGARYLLDPRRKHAPTLLDENPAPRLDYLGRAVRVAADLGAEAVSLWSGAAPPDLGETTAWERLREGCARVLDQAQRHGVTLGFEPEPGMLVDTLEGYERLARLLGDPPAFGLTLDLGHCHCLEDAPVPDCVRRAAPRLVHVQIEDMRRGVHEHLEFGAGGMDFPPVLRALDDCGYRGLVSVELPRHSHDGPAVAERSLRFLRRAAAC
ncbi:sugar phosphate isomerase/epimerase family protein [Streptomyces sp. DSM 44917]|uniref:Sugar phosphate isomerase/epimerase family protein n=1 Tax=Streptomyces boetiae TaxID=3075541 RepID=A0ABU2L754_9ACTN|nr:sugar phosphate isomerase/epimerase family protein [Streptomyces sp. DSM 44917]MDT0307397.1 sugar phosphate isomerase/epimerase family protein [Streptomyces sp. DSM 44917]